MSEGCRDRSEWGPHEYRNADVVDEDYEWWIHRHGDGPGMFVRGHAIRVECGGCDADMDVDDLVDGRQFLFLCPNCVHETVELSSGPFDYHVDVGIAPIGPPQAWYVFARRGQEAETELTEDGLVATIDDDEPNTFRITSETLFSADEEGSA